jgi:hypothetical protein
LVYRSYGPSDCRSSCPGLWPRSSFETVPQRIDRMILCMTQAVSQKIFVQRRGQTGGFIAIAREALGTLLHGSQRRTDERNFSLAVLGFERTPLWQNLHVWKIAPRRNAPPCQRRCAGRSSKRFPRYLARRRALDNDHCRSMKVADGTDGHRHVFAPAGCLARLDRVTPCL